MSKIPSEVVVVAAVAVRKASVMMAQRSEGMLAGFWEFPGGKVEAGETHSEALKREIREELGIECRVGAHFGDSEHHSAQGTIQLVFYLCELDEEPRVGDSHHAVAWLGANDFKHYRIAPADIPIIEKLQAVWKQTDGV